jgi:hypothetical protein
MFESSDARIKPIIEFLEANDIRPLREERVGTSMIFDVKNSSGKHCTVKVYFAFLERYAPDQMMEYCRNSTAIAVLNGGSGYEFAELHL